MNTPLKYSLALVVGLVAVGTVAAVALPILGRGIDADTQASVQQVVPTVFGTPGDDASPAPSESTVLALDPASSLEYSLEAGDGDLSGRTSQLTGAITRTASAITDAEFMVDLSTLAGDDDEALLGSLMLVTGGNTAASFVLTDPIPLPLPLPTGADGTGDSTAADDDAADQAATSDQTVTITGSLTVRGISKPVSAPATVHVDGDAATVTASIPISLTDYGIALSDMGASGVAKTAYLEVELIASTGR